MSTQLSPTQAVTPRTAIEELARSARRLWRSEPGVAGAEREACHREYERIVVRWAG